MRCAYINLDTAVERRKRLETHFKNVAPPELMLERVTAVTGAEAQHLPGQITPNEKGCFQSHLKAIRDYHDGHSHLLVLEDDVILSSAAFRTPSEVSGDWDLLLLDAAIGDVRLWASLEAERVNLSGRSRILALSTLHFASAAAYVVNRSSKSKVLDALDRSGMNAPYDLVMRDLVREQKLEGCLVFPFRTSIAPFSDDASQIRQGNPLDALSNAFRRRIFDGVGDGRSAGQLASEASAILGASKVATAR